MPIYTRTGDDGTTSLYGGKRVLKSDPRICLYGSIDELNSWIGWINAEIHDARLETIQRDLFMMEDVKKIKPRIKEMELWIDEMDKKLPTLAKFIIPNGPVHITRSICRRAEREAVSNKVDPVMIQYLNRLSDLLFTLARYIHMQGKIKEIIWKV